MRDITTRAYFMLVFVSCSLLGQAVAKPVHDSYWPYKNQPSTMFQSVLGPQSGDVAFVINGRPASFDKADVDLVSLESQIDEALRAMKQLQQNGQTTVSLMVAPVSKLAKIEKAIKSVGGSQLQTKRFGDSIEILYVMPNTFDQMEFDHIALLDAKACLRARMGDFSIALRTMLESLEIKRKAFGAESAQVANQLVDLGLLSQDRQKYQDMIKYLSDAIRIRSINGSDSELAATFNLLSIAYEMAGEAGKAAGAKMRAESILQNLNIDVDKRPVPESIQVGYHRWEKISRRIVDANAGIKEGQSRTRAEVEAIKKELYNIVYEEENARRQAEEAARLAKLEEQRRKMLEENEKLLEGRPDLTGCKFLEKSTIGIALAGSLEFYAANVDIGPTYRRLDNKTVAKIVNGNYSIEGEAGDWVVRVTSTFEGTNRVDKWKMKASTEKLRMIELVGVDTQDPYPVILVGKLKGK